MSSFFSGFGLAARQLFTNQKSLPKWIEGASTDDVRQQLAQLYLRGSEEQNIAPALTATELATLQERFKLVSLADTGLEECMAFYGGYPFQPSPLPLSYEDVLRAVVQLAGKDERALNERYTIRRRGRERVCRQGRTREDKLGLLFAALADGAPTQSNILDVLFLVQPRPNMERGPQEHEDLYHMAVRLAPTAPISTTKGITILREKLVSFLKAIDLENPVPEIDEIDFDTFRNILDEPIFTNAVYQKVEAIFLKA